MYIIQSFDLSKTIRNHDMMCPPSYKHSGVMAVHVLGIQALYSDTLYL